MLLFRRCLAPVLTILLVVAIVSPGNGATLYGKQIYLAADAPPSVRESAVALAGWLQTMTGADFAVVTTPGKQGIFLVLAEAKETPAIDLKPLRGTENSEAFQIYAADANRLWIIGKSALALQHGVYWYLDKLGCRWLNPGERWTVIPRRGDITLKINSLLRRVTAIFAEISPARSISIQSTSSVNSA